MARKPFHPGRQEADLTRRFRALRAEAVVLAFGTTFLAGLTILATIGASVAVREGMLLPSAVVLVGVIGGVAVLAKMKLDYADHSGDPALWRELLKERFDTGAAAPDTEIRRLTSMVIDLRSRLAAAEILADDQGRSLIAETTPLLDGWIDSIARLAHRLTELRVEGRLQADLAATSRRRLSQIEVQRLAALDPDLRRQLVTTADGMRQQIHAAERFQTVADSVLLRLEHAVAALGTVGSQLMLVLTRGSDLSGSQAIGLQISEEVASLEGLILALDRVSMLPEPAAPLEGDPSKARRDLPSAASSTEGRLQ